MKCFLWDRTVCNFSKLLKHTALENKWYTRKIPHKNMLRRDFKRKPQLGTGNMSYHTAVNGFHSLHSNYIVHFANGSIPEPPGNHLADLLGPQWILMWWKGSESLYYLFGDKIESKTTTFSSNRHWAHFWYVTLTSNSISSLSHSLPLVCTFKLNCLKEMLDSPIKLLSVLSPEFLGRMYYRNT